MRPLRSIPRQDFYYYQHMSFYEKFSYIGKLSEGFVRVKQGSFKQEKCGFVNERHEIAIPLIYSNVRDFHEGLAAVKVGNWATGDWGFINTEGQVVIPIKFRSPGYFFEGLAKVFFEGEWCFINRQGEKVISLKGYSLGKTFKQGYALVYKDQLHDNGLKPDWKDQVFGIIDKSGNEIVPCRIPVFNPDCIAYSDRIPQLLEAWHRGELG